MVLPGKIPGNTTLCHSLPGNAAYSQITGKIPENSGKNKIRRAPHWIWDHVSQIQHGAAWSQIQHVPAWCLLEGTSMYSRQE